MSFLKIILDLCKTKVVNNFLNLGSIQIAEMLLPLITVPYVVRVIGFDKVGLIAFATALISYFNIVINYGFNLTATKQISQNVTNLTEINRIFFSVFWTKIFLILVSFLLLTCLFIIPKMRGDGIIYILLFGNIVIQNLIPTWFLQGVQDLNFSTKIILILKIISTILVFILIKESSDYWILVLLPFLASLFSFIFIAFYIKKKYNLEFLKSDFNIIIKELNSGKYVFLSQIKISLFNSFNILILGILLNNSAVGIFSSADKIIKAISSIQIPIVSALFPYFSRIFNDNFLNGVKQIKRIEKYGSIIYFVIILCVFFSARLISQILFGSFVEEISFLIRIMLLIPLFVFLNNLYGTQFLLNISQDKVFMKNVLIAAFFNVICIIPLTYFFKLNGTAVSILTTEFLMFYLMKRSAINHINTRNEN